MKMRMAYWEGDGAREPAPSGGMAVNFLSNCLLRYTGRLMIYNVHCPISSLNEWRLRGWWLEKGRQHFERHVGHVNIKNSVYAPGYAYAC